MCRHCCCTCCAECEQQRLTWSITLITYSYRHGRMFSEQQLRLFQVGTDFLSDGFVEEEAAAGRLSVGV